MPKTSSEQLVSDISGDFHTYLRKGVRLDSILGNAHPDLDIEDIESLLRVHFVLTETDADTGRVGVLDFMRSLEDRIRRMKTTTTREVREHRGEVRGRVDWNATVKTRSRVGRPEEPIFVCLHPEEDYDIDENLVLKRLLAIVHEIVFDDLEYALDNPGEYRWLADWTSTDSSEVSRDGTSAAQALKQVFNENVYLQRVDAERVQITDRMIQSVKHSRNGLYRDAAELLDRYRLLTDRELDSKDAREILDHTLIAPEKPEVLFELYWIFKILGSYDDVRFRVLSRDNSSIVAEWSEGDYEYVMYHDSTGEAVTFNEQLGSESIEPDGYLYRMNAVLGRWQELSEALLDRGGSDTLWGGRPDILLERYRSNSESGNRELDQVFIGEVKYTRNADYAAIGLRELLEYMAFVRRSNGGYVETSDNLLASVSVKGALFVDNIKTADSESKDIDIIEYGDQIRESIVGTENLLETPDPKNDMPEE